VTVKVLPYWGELIVELDGAPISQIVPAKPSVSTWAGYWRHDRDRSGLRRHVAGWGCAIALKQAAGLPPASTPRFTLFAAMAPLRLASFSVRSTDEPAVDRSLPAIGALLRRWLSGLSNNPLIQPLCAAFIAGVVAAAPAVSNYRINSAGRFLSLHGAGPRSAHPQRCHRTSLVRASRWDRAV